MMFAGWGMSEIIVGTMTPVSKFRKFLKGSCGVLLPNTKAKIVDISSGESLGPGKHGELCIQGPQVVELF